MPLHTVALFGEAEKGDYSLAYFCESLDQLESFLGHPPEGSRALSFAIQAILFKYRLVFFRVREEGFSIPDYLTGLHFLQNKQLISSLSAICLPGVSDEEVIAAGAKICSLYKSILITSEADLYDHLTLRKPL